MTDLRLYIAVTFWGERYRRYFIDYCLASLLAPGNVPAISDKENARLLIATTEADWQAMQSEPLFQLALSYIRIEHVDCEVGTSDMNRRQIMRTMSAGHRRLADRMFEDRAHGIFIYPDSILAEGGIARLQELARQRVKVVMCLAVRFANEGLIDELKQTGLWRQGEPLPVGAVALARMSIAHMHSETRTFDFHGTAWDYGASAYFMTATPEKNLVFHTANWAPMLVDYGALATHDANALGRWTLDGDYIQKNFADPADFYIVRNTSELFITSFTPESQRRYSLAPFLPYRFRWLRRWLKVKLARHFLVTRGLFDPLKLEFIRLPIRMQGGDCIESDWQRFEHQSTRVMEEILDPSPNLFDRSMNFCFGCAFRVYARCKVMIRGDRDARADVWHEVAPEHAASNATIVPDRR